MGVLLDHVGLGEEEHPGRDGRAHARHQQRQVARRGLDVRDHRVQQGVAPVGAHHDAGDDVGHEDARDGEKDLLDPAVRAAHREQPDGQGRHRNAHVDRHAEEGQRRRDARELRERDRGVGDEEREHGEGGEAHAKLLADERREALAGDAAHARRGLLRHDEQEAHDGNGPELVEAEERAGVGVRGHAAGVRAREGGNHAGAHRRQDEAWPQARAFAPLARGALLAE